MAYSLPQEVIEQIKELTDISSIVAEHVRLRPSGSNFKGLCPFHKEKTSSFMVSPAKQIFKCFGCGEGGTAIHFVMKIKGLDFIGALEYLAQKCGVDITPYQKRDYAYDGRFQRFREMHKLAGEIFHKALLSNNKTSIVREYLSQRGITEEQIERYYLGYAPDSWDYLSVKLLSNGYTEQELIDASLAIRTKKGTIADYFRNRLMFPIYNPSGINLLGFGGRTLDGNDPKYLNSKDTIIFKKGETLYGLHLSLPHIMKHGRCILVEGYTDFMALYEAGFRETVATLGTSLTEDQANLIFSKAPQCVIFYDSDSAGCKAAARAVKILVKKDMDIFVACDPETGYDPDEMLKKLGKERVSELLNKGLNFFEYLADTFLREVKGTLTQIGPKMIERLAPYYYGEKSLMKRREMLNILEKKLSKPSDLLREEIQRYNPDEDSHYNAKQAVMKKSRSGDAFDKAERGIIALLLAKNSDKIRRKILQSADDEYFKNPDNLMIFRLIKELEISGGWNHQSVIERINDHELMSYISGLLLTGIPDDEETLLEGYLNRLEQRKIEEAIKILQTRLTALEKQGNINEALKVASEKNELVKLKKSII